MHAIPEKLNALRQQMEATMIRRLHDQREELERKLDDRCSAAEESAVKRTSQQLSSQISDMEKNMQARMDKVQLNADQCMPRIKEVMERCEVLKGEVSPLHSRADAAAARLDRLGVQSATTSKDCNLLNQDFRDAVSDLRALLAEQDKKRDSLEHVLRALVQSKTDSLATDLQAVLEKGDDNHRTHTSNSEALEERLRRSLQELEERGRREANFGDEGVVTRLTPEIQSLQTLIKTKSDECNQQAEQLVAATVTKLRDEIDAAAKRSSQLSDQQLDKKARELSVTIDGVLSQSTKLAESVRTSADASLRDQMVSHRTWTADCFSEQSNVLESFRQQLVTAEQRCISAAEFAKTNAVDLSNQRLNEYMKEVTNSMDDTVKHYKTDAEKVRQESMTFVQQESSRLESLIEEMGGKCRSNAEAVVNLANAHMQEKLTAAVKEAHERTDAARVECADALHKEAQARQNGFTMSDTARETLARNVREELRQTALEAETRLRSTAASSDERIDKANEAIRSLEHSLQAAVKDHVEVATSLRAQLKTERQMTEEQGADTTKKLGEMRDFLEQRLTLEACDIRKGLSDCRARIHDESTDLRAELREKAGKNDVTEVSKLASARCDEVSGAMDNHRSRLEACAADFSTRYRETRHEAAEGRLRSQREAIALGGEVTQLRAACTSLATGVVKAFTVLGLMTREVDDGGSGTTAIDSKPKGIEVEDLLRWEKAGKSLALRVERQWHKQEVAGYPNMLTLVERGLEDVSNLRSTLSSTFGTEVLSPEPMQHFATPGASTCATPNNASPPPKPGSPPQGVAANVAMSPQKPSTAPPDRQAPRQNRSTQ